MSKMSFRTACAVVVVAAAIVSSSLSLAVAGAQTTPGATMPLVVCPTVNGVPAPAKHFPPAMAMDVPAALSHELAAYADNQATLFVVAPRGWACQAAVGADGSASVSVHPHGQAGTMGGSWPRSARAVTADALPACFGCILDQACPFFASAAHELATSKLGPCPKHPPRETMTRLTSTAVEFTDPGGVHGTGEPSGGEYPATGVVTYKPAHGDVTYGSWAQTCTLPSSEHALCAAAIQAFVAMWDGYSSRP